MGDTDGSSSAARSAQLKNDNSKQKPLNILARIARLFSLGNQVKQLDTNENFVGFKTHDNNEVGNLLRLSVEDVSIPKADIVAVYDKITKDELFDTFKNTALTRLPVYENTLDNPLGFVHFKDFILKSNSDDNVSPISSKKYFKDLAFCSTFYVFGSFACKNAGRKNPYGVSN